jgi:hypothetical protein
MRIFACFVLVASALGASQAPSGGRSDCSYDSIEPGKLGDIVMLSGEFFDP